MSSQKHSRKNGCKSRKGREKPGSSQQPASERVVVENNLLANSLSEKRDRLANKVLSGDNSLETAKEFLLLENIDSRSDSLIDKYNKAPAKMDGTERAELASYLKLFASEMQAQYGEAITKELINGMLTGANNQRGGPQTKARQQAERILNTWGYHKSNASIGDAPLMFGGTVLGTTIKGMAANVAIGVGVNTGVQLAGKDPFSYVDAIMAGVTAAATTGKGIIASTPINIGGAAIGSGIKGENPVNSMAGAGAGTVVGGVGGEIIKGVGSKLGKDAVSDLTGAVLGGYIGEKTGNAVKDELDKKDKTDAKK